MARERERGGVALVTFDFAKLQPVITELQLHVDPLPPATRWCLWKGEQRGEMRENKGDRAHKSSRSKEFYEQTCRVSLLSHSGWWLVIGQLCDILVVWIDVALAFAVYGKFARGSLLMDTSCRFYELHGMKKKMDRVNGTQLLVLNDDRRRVVIQFGLHMILQR